MAVEVEIVAIRGKIDAPAPIRSESGHLKDTTGCQLPEPEALFSRDDARIRHIFSVGRDVGRFDVTADGRTGQFKVFRASAMAGVSGLPPEIEHETCHDDRR